MSQRVGKIIDWIKQHDSILLGAPRCVLCHAMASRTPDLCAGCDRDLSRIGQACLRCGIPLPVSSVCGPCQIRPPPYRRATSALTYSATTRWMIRRFKFHGELVYGRVLSRCMVQRLRAEQALLPELLLPVPLHPQRWRTRGFNQAEELARDIGRELQIPLENSALVRMVATREQAGLTARERRRNLRSAFVVRRPISARSVALVDDVMTTGSTVRELALVLRDAGVQQIDVWVAARAVREITASAPAVTESATLPWWLS